MDTTNFWKELEPSLRSFIRSKVKDQHSAEDILQNVYLKIQAGHSGLKDPTKRIPWIYSITRNAIVDYHRESKKNILVSQHRDELASDSEAQANVMHEFSMCVPGMIGALPEKYREALYLVEIEGLSQKELAERLGISYSGAKSRVQRAREKLKELLLDCCHIDTDAYGNVIEYQPRQFSEKD